MNIFEKASIEKVRFQVPGRGEITVEQAQDLPLQHATRPNLDALAISVLKELEETTVKSFVTETSLADEALHLKLDILKAIIARKKAEAKKAQVRASAASERSILRKALVEKQLQAKTSGSIEDLEARIKALDALDLD